MTPTYLYDILVKILVIKGMPVQSSEASPGNVNQIGKSEEIYQSKIGEIMKPMGRDVRTNVV